MSGRKSKYVRRRARGRARHQRTVEQFVKALTPSINIASPTLPKFSDVLAEVAQR